jgi:hypothetical protein
MIEGAELLAKYEIAGGHLLSFRMDTPGLGNYIRLLYWKPAAYVLVIDRVGVDYDGVFTLGVNWRCAGRIESLDDGTAELGLDSGVDGRFYVQVCEGLDLTAETNSYPAPGAPPKTPPVEETMLHATMDRHGREDGLEVATLLHAVKGTDGPRYQLGRRDENWIVEGPDQTLGFRNGSGPGELEIDASPGSPWTDGCLETESPDSSSRGSERGAIPAIPGRRLRTDLPWSSA